MAFRGVFVLLCAADDFIVEALEDERQGVGWERGGAAVGGHDGGEFGEGGFGCYFVASVFKDVEDVIANKTKSTLLLFHHIPEKIERSGTGLTEHTYVP